MRKGKRVHLREENGGEPESSWGTVPDPVVDEGDTGNEVLHPSRKRFGTEIRYR